MAEVAAKKTKKVTLTNEGEGPRSFADPEGGTRILRPGESYSGDIHECELADLSSDLVQGKAAAKAKTAEPGNGGKGGAQDTRTEAQKTADAAKAIDAAARALIDDKANTEEVLRKAAEEEGVEGISSDDDRKDIALKLAQHRAAKSAS